MQMQNREIAIAAGWSESTDDVDASNIATENPPILDAPLAPPQNTSAANALVTNTLLLDAEDRVAPNQIDAEKPVWRNPIPRTILVVIGAGALGFTLVRLTEGNGLMNQPQSQVATTASPTSIAQVNGDDKGELQAKLANSGLKQKIAGLKANKAKVPNRSTTNPPATPKSPTVAPVTNVQPSSVSTYNPPPPVVAQAIPRPLITQSFPRPLPKPISFRPAPPVIPPTQSIPQRPHQTAVRQNPVEQWMAAANIGNYGGMSSVSNSPTASVPSDDSYQTADYQTNSTATDNSNWQLSGGLGRPPAQTKSKPEANNQPSNYQEVNYSTAATNVVVGTRATGKLETPIAWSGKLENPGQNFLIQLTEPIKAANKSIAVSKGAYLVAQVSNATESGLIQMSVSSVVVTENGQTSERPISPGARANASNFLREYCIYASNYEVFCKKDFD